jgi:thiol:disulfide interchange protein
MTGESRGDGAERVHSVDLNQDPLWMRIYIAAFGLVLFGLGVAVAGIAVAQLNTAGLPALGALGAGALVLLAFGVLAIGRTLPDQVAGVIGVVALIAILALLLLVGVTGLIDPGRLVSGTPRHPHTPGQARAYGAVITCVALILVAIAIRGWRSQTRHRGNL